MANRFFLELFLPWSPVAYWAPTDLGSSSFSILSFCLFILFMGFSRQEYWSGLPFSSPMDHILSVDHTLHMDISRWSTPKSDWLCSLQPKIEKFYAVSKNKTGSWLWLRSWAPYCQIQTEIEESRENHLPGSSIHGIFQARILEWGAIAFSH